jgi:hypothetical protein
MMMAITPSLNASILPLPILKLTLVDKLFSFLYPLFQACIHQLFKLLKHLEM